MAKAPPKKTGSGIKSTGSIQGKVGRSAQTGRFVEVAKVKPKPKTKK